METRESPLYWSLPLGTWFRTRVRVSIFLPLVILALCFRLESAKLGLVFGALLFISVLLHEFGHIFAARLSGGYGDEILLWPLGGLAFCQEGPSFGSRVLTPLAGPLVNLALCAATFPAVLSSPWLAVALNPFEAPPVMLTTAIVSDVCLIAFTVNWVMFLANLIPVYPLDGGQILKAVLRERLPSSSAVDIYVRIGAVCGFIGLIVGLMIDSTWLVAFSAFVLVLNIQETAQLRTSESYDDSFMGYDFSQGYTSLERSTEGEPRSRTETRAGFFARWRQAREQRRREREREEAERIEQQLDALLEKVHTHGYDSLSETEKRTLRRASDRYRDKQADE
ncbi:MAG: hypothetical protein KY476_19170 [Planctomycetes bacterium]|nr:hypothetical protein [Planctomycetota bacterium]